MRREIASRPLCLPKGADYCEILSRVAVDGATADIRRYGWNGPADGDFCPSHCYIDYSLARRTGETFMVAPDGRGLLSPGALAFFPPGTYYDTHCEPSDNRSFCLSYDSNRASALGECGQQMLGSLEPCLDLRNATVERYVRRAAEEIKNPGFATEVMIELISDTIVIELMRHFIGRPEKQAAAQSTMAPWRLRWLKERIADALGKPLSVSALAHECGISARHLVRTFKNTEGITLSDYIAHERIARAKRLLAETDQPVKVIAGMCGFASASSFSVAFLNSLGETPRKYRDGHRALRIACGGLPQRPAGG